MTKDRKDLVEPVVVVQREQDYWSRGHFYKGSKNVAVPLNKEFYSLPIGTKLYARPVHPSVSSAELDRLHRELDEARKALEPFADAVFNDNGDMTVNRSFPTYDDFVRAYFAHKKARAALQRYGDFEAEENEVEIVNAVIDDKGTLQ